MQSRLNSGKGSGGKRTRDGNPHLLWLMGLQKRWDVVVVEGKGNAALSLPIPIAPLLRRPP